MVVAESREASLLTAGVGFGREERGVGRGRDVTRRPKRGRKEWEALPLTIYGNAWRFYNVALRSIVIRTGPVIELLVYSVH